jgi:hypothetical protein
MRDYLTLSWARFSKDVQSHTLQISKILAHPAPRAGDLIKLDASAKSDSGEASLEVIARFPGGLDFGRGLVDVNFTMWPLFKCLNIDNILTLCEVASSPSFLHLVVLTLGLARSHSLLPVVSYFSLVTRRCSAYAPSLSSLMVPYSGSYSAGRLRYARSSTSSSSVAGTVSPYLPSTLETQRFTSMIPVRGSWASRPRRDIAFVRLRRFAYAICKSYVALRHVLQ